MDDALSKAIHDAKESLEFFASTGKNPIEEATRDTLINLILVALGWPVLKPRLVETQYEVLTSGDDRAVDYALKDDGNDSPVAFVEAKRLSNRLGAKEERQLNNYVWTYVGGLGLKRASKFGPAVLTNGRVWKFYPIDAGEGSERYAGWSYSIDLQEDDVGKCRDALERYLSRGRVLDGSANRALGGTALRGQVRGVWEKLLRSPPDDFVEFVQGKFGKELPAELIREVISDGDGAGYRRGSAAAADAGGVERPRAGGGKRLVVRRAAGSECPSIRVIYKGRTIGGGPYAGQRTLREVLGLLARDYGVERLLDACRSSGWLVKHPGDVIAGRGKLRWLQISDDACIKVDFRLANIKKRLDGLAVALGIADRLSCEVVAADAES